MGCASKLVLLAMSLLILLLVPSTAAARIGPAATKAIDASQAQRLELSDMVSGPESVTFDKHGAGLYVSTSDGHVLSWHGEDVGWKMFAYSPSYTKNKCGTSTPSQLPSVAKESLCGRPLGLRLHHVSSDLYIADAYMRLMHVGKDGGETTVLAKEDDGGPFKFTNGVTVLAKEADGGRFKFTNGVDIDQVTGDIYFTDSSTKYTRAQNQRVTATGDSTGRILKYNPETKEVTRLMSGLPYPNGIAISADRTHLVVALTSPCRLLRYWLTGPKAMTSELFANLPGYPDNIRPDGKGGYWVALNREKLEFRLGPDNHMVAIRIGAQGEKMQEIRGSKSVTVRGGGTRGWKNIPRISGVILRRCRQ